MALAGDGAMQMNGLAELITVAKYWREWRDPRWIVLVLGVLATVGTQDAWLDGYGIVAYGIGPLMFIPLSAGFIAGARASRFVENVFTAPVRRAA